MLTIHIFNPFVAIVYFSVYNIMCYCHKNQIVLGTANIIYDSNRPDMYQILPKILTKYPANIAITFASSLGNNVLKIEQCSNNK